MNIELEQLARFEFRVNWTLACGANSRKNYYTMCLFWLKYKINISRVRGGVVARRRFYTPNSFMSQIKHKPNFFFAFKKPLIKYLASRL